MCRHEKTGGKPCLSLNAPVAGRFYDSRFAAGLKVIYIVHTDMLKPSIDVFLGTARKNLQGGDALLLIRINLGIKLRTIRITERSDICQCIEKSQSKNLVVYQT